MLGRMIEALCRRESAIGSKDVIQCLFLPVIGTACA